MPGPHSAMLESSDYDAAVEDLHRSRRTDGLPIVLPTPERVERMLLHSAGLDGDLVIGNVAPGDGALTVEKAAINAVMAGCTYEMFPLVIAACEALVSPEFEAGPMQATTHAVTPLIIVNGPGREIFGVHSGSGALGPGFRVNATLGRAIRLIMINVGRGIPGIGDMATVGSPAKFSCCLAESEEDSPFPPMHVSLGFSADETTITMLGVEGPHSLLFAVDDASRDGEMFLRALAAAFANSASNNIYFQQGNVAAILNPTHVQAIHGSGFTRKAAQEMIFEHAVRSRAELRQHVGGTVVVAPGSDDLLRVVQKPEDILLLVAGGEGGAYSTYFPTWGGGRNGNRAVTRRVRWDTGCDMPASVR